MPKPEKIYCPFCGKPYYDDELYYHLEGGLCSEFNPKEQDELDKQNEVIYE